jgi:hypothetical protein
MLRGMIQNGISRVFVSSKNAKFRENGRPFRLVSVSAKYIFLTNNGNPRRWRKFGSERRIFKFSLPFTFNYFFLNEMLIIRQKKKCRQLEEYLISLRIRWQYFVTNKQYTVDFLGLLQSSPHFSQDYCVIHFHILYYPHHQLSHGPAVHPKLG